VWLQLEEKRIPYKVDKVPMRCYGTKPAEFMRLSRSGLLPVAVIDGEAWCLARSTEAQPCVLLGRRGGAPP
jgi:glutathione S-transferase